MWRVISTQYANRVILSRELGIDEIAEIKQRCPDMELEIFVHGALCMAYSGRCLISSYMNKRDPNQGACTNACRWEYGVQSCSHSSTDELIASSKTAVVQKIEEPGEHYELEEDEHGTYFFNSKDLRAVQHVEKLIAVGVDSLKIEGRTKSPYYVARTAQVYRKAIDDALAGNTFDESLLSELEGLANRGYTDGFLQRHKPSSLQNYEYGSSIGQQQVVGDIIHVHKHNSDWVFVDVKNKFSVGDEMMLMTPAGNTRFICSDIHTEQGEPLVSALGSGHKVFVKLPLAVNPHNAMLVRCS
ncbi:U32 family peptidase C-terminal domain-containing protein [Cellvibrio sp.]|uniref:U32 family peptidase C-terminal domain-containing protein n=1 Tax=Cellvibrio sp. TaxID=1965322 RepID=UPI00396483DA